MADENKTFTQEEVNGFVESRIADFKKKFADYDTLKDKASKFDEMEEANKTELQKANDRVNELQKQIDSFTSAENLRKVREKVSAEMGVPMNLLSGSDEESCREQAKAILEFAKPHSYPGTKRNNETKQNNSSSDDDFRELAHNFFQRG